MNKLINKYTNDRYTRNDFIVYLSSMQPPASAETNSSIKPNSTVSRKKSSLKEDESEKITERMEGGIIVRRYKGIKIEPW